MTQFHPLGMGWRSCQHGSQSLRGQETWKTHHSLFSKLIDLPSMIIDAMNQVSETGAQKDAGGG